MNEDRILSMFFEKARWQYAIEKGLFKDMNKAVMYQLTEPKARLAMYQRIKSGNYKIMPPHTAKIPKDNGDFRTVYVNEPVDRILLSIANDLLFELMPDMVHPRCTSYQKGIGCGRVVQEVSRKICSANGNVIGWKSDLSKYFDSVPIEFIDWAFDKVEEKHGKSALIDVIRDYYHTDIYFDEDNNLCEKYQSLKQGCSVAAWLADVVLYHIDEMLSSLNGYYVRYSDDILFVGEDYEKAMDILKSELEKMQMTLNPKKVEYLDANHWFKFLGYSIKGHNISLSSTRIKTFQKEIEKRTIKKRDTTMTKAINAVNRYLYKGYCDYSWSTQVLPVINVKEDIDKLNAFVMDCIRAVKTGKRKVGGLGYVKKTFKHTCKGNPYVRLQNKDIFVSDLEKKVFVPLCDLARKMCDSKTYKEVYDAVHEFNKNRKHLAWDTKQADAFITAYKGSGSYYTMRNLIMFHGARFMKNGRKMSESNSLKELESKAKSYEEQGWRMLGVLKQLIKESGINIQGKIDEWKK